MVSDSLSGGSPEYINPECVFFFFIPAVLHNKTAFFFLLAAIYPSLFIASSSYYASQGDLGPTCHVAFELRDTSLGREISYLNQNAANTPQIDTHPDKPTLKLCCHKLIEQRRTPLVNFKF